MIGIITPSSAPFSPFSLGSEYLYLGRTPISASDAPSYKFRRKRSKHCVVTNECGTEATSFS
jgi:hypothetical protein